MALGGMGRIRLMWPSESPCRVLSSQERQSAAAGRQVSSSQCVCSPRTRSG